MSMDMIGAMHRADVKEFRITRTIKAPLTRVWKAWTDESQLRQWWGPKGFDNLGVKLDLRVGGTMHYGLRSPDGVEFYGRFVFHEIVPEERLVFVVSFADKDGNVIRHPWEGDWPLHILTTVDFEAVDGATEVTVHWIPVDASDAEAQAFEKGLDSCHEGWSGTFDNLDEMIERD